MVYVDNDPVVLAHARALLTSGSEGRTDYISRG
ncbi:SAM-dependent methyltransferase [Streptomyces longwoodensis]